MSESKLKHQDKLGHFAAPLSMAQLYVLLAVNLKTLHGYGIYQEVVFLTDGGLSVDYSAIRKHLVKLTKVGYLEKSSSQNNNAHIPNEPRIRRGGTYSLTQTGRRKLAQEQRRLQRFITLYQSKQQSVQPFVDRFE